MFSLHPAGSGTLIDPLTTSCSCPLQPDTRVHGTSSLRLRRARSLSSSLLHRRTSQSQIVSCSCSCLKRQRCSGSARTQALLCRAASQPLPSARPSASVVASPRQLRRNSSHPRLDSPCRSTLAEPPVREELSETVFEPDYVKDKDIGEEWFAFRRRLERVKEVTELTTHLQQSLEEIGALGESSFSVRFPRSQHSCQIFKISSGFAHDSLSLASVSLGRVHSQELCW